jgi:uncharacterized phage protein gp47/JayE
MAFGLQSSGFKIKRLDDIKTEIENSLRASLGSGINLLPESVFGQIVGVFAERESLLWEQLDSIYDAQYPDTATDNQLDLAVSLVGISRLQATRSLVQRQLFFGTAGTVIPSGTQISVLANPTAIFETIGDVTLVTGADEVQTLTFSSIPDSGSFTLDFGGQDTLAINWDDDASALRVKVEALSSIGVGNVAVTGDFSSGFIFTFQNQLQKQPVPNFIVENNVLLDGVTAVTTSLVETVAGEIQGSTNLQCLEFGPVSAPQRSVTEIETPVFGLDSTINPESGIVGRNRETDNELRIRRELEIQSAGAATVGAIQSALANVENVEAAIVFYNNASIPDLDGRPPHSIEAIVQGGDQVEIAQTLFETVAAGIGFFGDITQNAIDSEGFTHVTKFSRPTEVELLLECDLTVDALVFPPSGVVQVQNNFKAFIDSLLIGQDVITIPRLLCALNGVPQLGIPFIPGILDVELRIAKKPTSPTTDDTIVIARREIATIDLADITVTIL